MTLWRSIGFFIKIAIIVAVAVWLANRPGDVSVLWLGHRADLPVGFAIAVLVVLLLVLFALWRLWRFLRRAPRELSASRSNSRKAKGYRALTRGLTAAAAGDAVEARKQARIAHTLLQEPSLTLLLAAQAAQLDGDDAAAERYFAALAKNDDSALLGLRGLINAALKRGDDKTAMQYAEQAVKVAPQAAWAGETAHRLQLKDGRYDAAEASLKAWIRSGGIDAHAGQRRRAVILAEKARQALVPHAGTPTAAGAAEPDLAAAMTAAREALKLDGNFVPARFILAQLLIRLGKGREAARLIEQAWDTTPHPLLARVFARAESSEAPLDRARRMERLARQNSGSADSHRAAAETALVAQLWGEARRHLERVAELERAANGDVNQSTARLFARLEEAERGNMAAARDWLERVAVLPPDPIWICDQCGAPGEAGPQCGHWQAICPHCGAIDSLVWKRPQTMQMMVLGAPGQVAGRLIEGPAGAGPGSASPAADGARPVPAAAAEGDGAISGSSVDAARLVN